MIGRVERARAADEALCAEVQTFGQCVDIQVTPQDGFLPGRCDYQVLWSGPATGGGSTQVDDMSAINPSSCMSPNRHGVPSPSRSQRRMPPRPLRRRSIG